MSRRCRTFQITHHAHVERVFGPLADFVLASFLVSGPPLMLGLVPHDSVAGLSSHGPKVLRRTQPLSSRQVECAQRPD